ncbi:MAG: tyrosine-type recombinase/integrase [Defluviitaleaceae bacterium]|nr:tyrosine-type recombinase/integrase [Defluviitaleaceae bacterium]
MTAEPIRDMKALKEFAEHYLKRGQLRNHTLIVMGLNTALRISDLLSLKWEDLYDFERNVFREHFTLVEGKTRKTKTIALNKAALSALSTYFPHRNGAFIFPNNRASADPINRTQAHRIIKTAARNNRAAIHVSCHSLRKTFGYHAWKAGVTVVLLMDIYNHSDYNITRKYLGISQDELDAVYKEVVLGTK